MKISQKQANLLAKEVLNQLTKLKVGEVPETLINQIKKFREKRSELQNACNVHNNNLREHEKTWSKILGLKDGERIFYGDSMDEIISKLKKREVPSVSVIEDEIILGAMFANDDDLQSFVNKIVKKFDKKTKSKVLSN